MLRVRTFGALFNLQCVCIYVSVYVCRGGGGGVYLVGLGGVYLCLGEFVGGWCK